MLFACEYMKNSLKKGKKITIFPQKLMFRLFSDDHKNFIFKDRGVKFIVLDNIVIKIDKIC